MADTTPVQTPLGAPSVATPTSEIVVLFKPGVGVKSSVQGLMSTATNQPHPVHAMVSQHGASIRPLFAQMEERAQASTTTQSPSTSGQTSTSPQNLHLFYHTHVPTEHAQDLQKQINDHDDVDGAYIAPQLGLPLRSVPMPSRVAAPPVTPDFMDKQIYLNPAPAGIDARFAWTIPGGRGKGIRITDCEWGWRFTHEDLRTNKAGVVSGATAVELPDATSTTDEATRNLIAAQFNKVHHGTAVIGVIGGDSNPFGVTGIASDAILSASSFENRSPEVAIMEAADKLSAGDVILLEIHAGGPKYKYNPNDPLSQFGYIATEWWPPSFAAIQYAVSKGIIVVEAAGNGTQDLDDPIYNTPLNGTFGKNWKNPFAVGGPDSGAIIVGAGAPPPGTHGTDWGPDRSRLDFSNWGSRIDVQGWGREVTTTGYGDLQGGDVRDNWYTNKFSGTSSASPVVTGAVLSMQGVLSARGRRRLNPSEARLLLRSIGTPQLDNSPKAPLSQRIGKRPNLRTLIPAAVKLQTRSAPYGPGKNSKVLVANPAGIALLGITGTSKTAENWKPSTIHANGSSIGSWVVNTANNSLGPAADLDNDGLAETLITSPWGMGVLKTSGSSFTCPYLAQNGTFIDNWRLNTADNVFGPCGDFDGDRASEILISSPWGLGILKYQGNTMKSPFASPNGTRFAGPTSATQSALNTVDNEFGPVGDFDGDGRTEFLIVSSWGLGVAKYNGTAIVMMAMVQNGTKIPGPSGQTWLLNTADNRFGPVADYDGDGKAEILVTSPWGIGVLKLSGAALSATVIAENKTLFAAPTSAGGGSWSLNTADNTFVTARKFLPNIAAASLLVTSPWGISILAQSGSTFSCQLLSKNGTTFMYVGDTNVNQGWSLDTLDNWHASAADFDGDGVAEIFVSGRNAIGCLKLQAVGKMVLTAMNVNGVWDSWNVNTHADDYGHGV